MIITPTEIWQVRNVSNIRLNIGNILSNIKTITNPCNSHKDNKYS